MKGDLEMNNFQNVQFQRDNEENIKNIIKELIRNRENLSSEDELVLLKRLLFHIENEIPVIESKLAEILLCLRYIDSEKFDMRGWAFTGVDFYKKGEYAFLNDASAEMFYLLDEESGNVIPRYVEHYETKEAINIQEAINDFIF